jgi:hypothetical protein
VEMRDLATVHATAPADDVGYFVIRPVPVACFRLRCHTTGSASVLTGWIEV